jgi:single-stranded-DNA-specific exonuclease
VDLRPRSVDEHLVERLASALRVRPATARCLVGRGVADPGDARGFIDPRLAALRPPVGLAGFARAVSRIADGVERGEQIGVFGDYDVDGVTTAVLLTSFLRAAGAHVDVAVARRDAGYGFTPGAAADFALRGCRLVITGDCGTNDHEAIAVAAVRGIDVIVVDHHAVPPADAPHPALALVNPYRADSTFPFRGMASVGLAFYVAAAVRTELRERGYFGPSGGPSGAAAGRSRREPDVRELLDLVALGTIADLVPLTAENRILTSLGLRRLQARARPGLAALLEVAGVDGDREIDARTISWKLAPRINAPGRLGAAEPSLSLLLADAGTAAARARVLEEANTQRRALQERVMAEALELVGDDPGPAIVLAGEGWPSGIVGIVAAKLVDRYQRPAFVVGIDPESGIGRGSARTAGGIDLYRALGEAARTHGCLDKFGGHAAAAGFTVSRESIGALAEALGGACARLAAGSGPISTQRWFDAEVGLAEVDERLAQELAGLGPFGQANPPPLLVTRNARVTALRRVGDGSHVKLTVEDDRAASRGAIGFGLGERLGALGIEVGARLDLAFLPTVSTWQGRRSAELELADVVPSP